MSYYSEQIVYANEKKLSNEKFSDIWNKIENKNFEKYDSTTAWIYAKWKQNGTNNAPAHCKGFNYYVPETNDSCGCYEDVERLNLQWDKNCAISCTATAMGLILKYWNYSSINNYNIYDWSNMSNVLTTESSNFNNQHFNIAHLLADCGYFSDIDYCTFWGNNKSGPKDCESFTTPKKARKAFVEKFGFSDDANLDRKRYYTDKKWKNKIKSNIDNGRPILYAALDIPEKTNKKGAKAPHSFVLDGYNSDDFFHFNLGWGGDDDGWYKLDGIIGDTTHSYSYYQRAIFNLYPEKALSCSGQIDLGDFYKDGGLDDDDFPWKAIPIVATLLSADNTQIEDYRTIYNGEEVKYIAYDQIVLRQGFHVEQGAKFHAYLTTCPEQRTKNIVKSIETKKEVTPSIYIEQQKLLVSPNPFINSVSVSYKLTESSHCQVEIYDLYGQLQKVLVNQNQTAGTHQTYANLSGLPAGVYMCVLKTNNATTTQKIIKTN